MPVMDWFSARVFNLVHGNNLVYNTCWEDPRLDRVALELMPDDNVWVITTAGCKALDYALASPHHVYAVDMNPRQNLTGEYSPGCCPEYLTADGFERLKGGLVDRVSVHTNSVQGFLDQHDGTISRYVLLDHMDWLSDKFFPLLELEWQAILNRAAEGTRILWRSGGLRTDFIERVQVTQDGRFYIADLVA